MEENPEDEPLKLIDLHINHPGLTKHTAGSFCEAASVCMSEFHLSPSFLNINLEKEAHVSKLTWPAVDARTRNSQANHLDATCNGAYAVSFICVERTMQLVVIGRAEELSGADWYVAPVGAGIDDFGGPDLDDPAVKRLEVSGRLEGPIGARLTEKKTQLRKGKSSIPGIASVVRFDKPQVIIESVA